MNKSGTPGATPDLLCQSACDLRANHQPRWFTNWWLKGESKNCEIQIKLYLVQKIQISTSRIEKICLNWDRVTKKVWSCIYEYDLYDLDIYKYICVCVYIYSIFALSLSIPFRQGGPSPNHSAGRTWRTITRAGGNPQGTKPNCFSPNGNWPNHKIEGKNGRKLVGNVQKKQLNIEIHRNRWKMMPSSSDLGGWSPDSLVGRRDEAQMKSIFQRLKCLVDGSQLAWRQQEKSSTSGQHLILTFSRDPTKARTHPADILYGAFCIHIK